jgi:hypothetical protein
MKTPTSNTKNNTNNTGRHLKLKLKKWMIRLFLNMVMLLSFGNIGILNWKVEN